MFADTVPFSVIHEAKGHRVALPTPISQLLDEMVLPEGDRPLVHNFVTTLDGSVKLSDERPESAAVAMQSAHDWLLLSLWRSVASTIIVSAGAARFNRAVASTAEHALPALSEAFGEIRASLGLGPLNFVVVSARGDLPAQCATWTYPSTVVTTREGAGRLRGVVPDHVDVVDVGPVVSMRDAVVVARRVSHDRTSSGAPSVVLSEVGPVLFSDLVSAGGPPFTLCLTISPLLAGSAPGRLSMVEGPGGAIGELDGIMSAQSHLFLRYRVRP